MTERQFEIGGLLIADTSVHVGRWRKLTCLTDATFASSTISQDIAGDFNGQAIKAGTTITGIFTELQLSAGSLVAYS